MAAIGLQFLAKLILLHTAIEAKLWSSIVLIPFAARIGPLIWTRFLPPLHAGLAARFKDSVRSADIALWIVLLLAASWWASAMLAAPPFMLLWARWLCRKFGGISGDGHGAGIELTESALLLLALVVARVA